MTGIDGSNAVNNAGLVYQCPILPGLCGPVSGNGADNDIRLFDYEGMPIYGYTGLRTNDLCTLRLVLFAGVNFSNFTN